MKYNEDDRIAQSMGYLDFDDHMECLYQEEQYEKAYREQEEMQYYTVIVLLLLEIFMITELLRIKWGRNIIVLEY